MPTVGSVVGLAHDGHRYSKCRIIKSAHCAIKVAQKICLECIANFPGYCLKSNYVATEIKAKTRAVIEMQRGGAETKTETQAQ